MSNTLSMALASSVMAATEKVVSQALEGAWNEVPRTLEQRRELLNQLSAQAGTAEHAWLQALQQAVAESDSAVEAMAPTATPAQTATHEDTLHAALRQSLIQARSG